MKLKFNAFLAFAIIFLLRFAFAQESSISIDSKVARQVFANVIGSTHETVSLDLNRRSGVTSKSADHQNSKN